MKRGKSDAVTDVSKKQGGHSGVGPPVVSNDHKPARKRQVSFISGDEYNIPVPLNDDEDTVRAFSARVELICGTSGLLHLTYAAGTREDDQPPVVLNVGSKYNYPVAMNFQSDNTIIVTDPNESMARFDTTSAGDKTMGWVLDASRAPLDGAQETGDVQSPTKRRCYNPSSYLPRHLYTVGGPHQDRPQRPSDRKI